MLRWSNTKILWGVFWGPGLAMALIVIAIQIGRDLADQGCRTTPVGGVVCPADLPTAAPPARTP